jgi:hypothetical protein
VLIFHTERYARLDRAMGFVPFPGPDVCLECRSARLAQHPVPGRHRSLDLWIRSPCAPIDERVAALERWVARRPNRVVFGSVPAENAGKYSPVGEYLRASLTDQAHLEAPHSGTVWIALAWSGGLGEWTAEKGVSSFTRSAALPAEVLPQVAAAAPRYLPEAKAHLCALLQAAPSGMRTWRSASPSTARSAG